jgi:hypothetical protein
LWEVRKSSKGFTDFAIIEMALREGGNIKNRQREILGSQSDRITTLFFQVPEKIFPPEFLEEKNKWRERTHWTPY